MAAGWLPTLVFAKQWVSFVTQPEHPVRVPPLSQRFLTCDAAETTICRPTSFATRRLLKSHLGGPRF